MTIEFTGKVWYWRGPSPFHFITVPESHCIELNEIVSLVTYGWGMIPVQATIGNTVFTTAMFPKNGAYILPLKVVVRRAEGIEVDEDITVSLTVQESFSNQLPLN